MQCTLAHALNLPAWKYQQSNYIQLQIDAFAVDDQLTTRALELLNSNTDRFCLCLFSRYILSWSGALDACLPAALSHHHASEWIVPHTSRSPPVTPPKSCFCSLSADIRPATQPAATWAAIPPVLEPSAPSPSGSQPLPLRHATGRQRPLRGNFPLRPQHARRCPHHARFAFSAVAVSPQSTNWRAQAWSSS